MTENDPKQVIIEYISEPLGQIEPEPALPPGIERKGTRGITRKGGGLGAKVQTIRFLQEHYFLCVRQDIPGYWRTVGGANFHPGEENMPNRSYPWVNLAGGWNRDLFWAGGRVLDNGLDVVRVSVIC